MNESSPRGLYALDGQSLRQVLPGKFQALGMTERLHIQAILREQIHVISPNTRIIDEEFSKWEDSKRRIDLLGVDREGKLVVIELKRGRRGGHMELQAIRYAAMVANMTFDTAVEVYADFLKRTGQTIDAKTDLEDFLGESAVESVFGQEVRIVLVSADFSKELTTAVLWLRDSGIDIRCVRLTPYALNGQVVLDVQQIVPIPEAADYTIGVLKKEMKEREDRENRWTEAKFLSRLRDRHGEKTMQAATEVLRWVEPKVHHIFWGTGKSDGGFFAVQKHGKRDYLLFRMLSGGRAVFWFDKLKRHPPFDDVSKRRTVLDMLNEVDGFHMDYELIETRPRFSISVLETPAAMARFKDTVDWMLEQIHTINVTP